MVPTGTMTSVSLPPRPVQSRPPPGSPVGGTERALDPEIHQRIDAVARAKRDAAAIAAVAAIRTAEWDELLAPEADATAPAVARPGL
jgi:hypothetical protein